MQRIEKKKDAPFLISESIDVQLRNLSKHWNLSLQATAHDVIMDAISDSDIILKLAPYFKKGFCIGDSAYFMGHAKTGNYKVLLGNMNNPKRVHVKLPYDEWKVVSSLEDALGCPLAHACALLVTLGLERGVKVGSTRLFSLRPSSSL